MTERRARGAGPTGRGERRMSRVIGSRPSPGGSRTASGATGSRGGPDTGTSGRIAAGTRAIQRRIHAAGVKTRSRSTTAEDRHDHTMLGLSTGRAVILAAVVCALALTLAVPLRTYFSQRAEAAKLAQQRHELEDDLARLRDRRAQQQDPAYIRSEARDRLRLVMPGETPYIVQVPGIEQPAVPVPPTRTREPDPWYTDLWRSISQPRSAPPETPAPGEPPGEEGTPP